MPKFKIQYGADSIEVSRDYGFSLRQLLGDRHIKAGLGFGDRVRALVGGTEYGEDQALPEAHRATVVIETLANQKAQNFSITARYGTEQRVSTYPAPVTIATVVNDPHNKGFLGYGDNVRVLVGGIEQTLDTVLPHNAVIVIETKANQKAVVA